MGLSSVISLLMEWIPAFFYDMIIKMSIPYFPGDDREDRECVVLILLLQYPCGVDYASSVPSLRLVASRVPLHGIQFLIDQFH